MEPPCSRSPALALSGWQDAIGVDLALEAVEEGSSGLRRVLAGVPLGSEGQPANAATQ